MLGPAPSVCGGEKCTWRGAPSHQRKPLERGHKLPPCCLSSCTIMSVARAILARFTDSGTTFTSFRTHFLFSFQHLSPKPSRPPCYLQIERAARSPRCSRRYPCQAHARGLKPDPHGSTF